MKIINKKPFYYGVILTIGLLFVFLVGENMGSGSKGISIHNFELYNKILILIPGIALIFNGIMPKTFIGKVGGLIYNFYSWVNKNKYKKAK